MELFDCCLKKVNNFGMTYVGLSTYVGLNHVRESNEDNGVAATNLYAHKNILVLLFSCPLVIVNYMIISITGHS